MSPVNPVAEPPSTITTLGSSPTSNTNAGRHLQSKFHWIIWARDAYRPVSSTGTAANPLEAA